MKYIACGIILLGVAAFVIFGARGGGVVHAQGSGSLPTPGNFKAVNGPNAGEAILTWDAVNGANFYRVGWITVDDATRAVDGEVDIFDFCVFADISGVTKYTVTGLEPGKEYYFTVASVEERFGQASPLALSILTLNADGQTCPVCPVCASGSGTQLPPTPVGGDYDADNDGLIEIRSIAQLDVIRYDLDGDGVSEDAAYTAAFPGAAAGMGCPSGGCSGYELANDQDYATVGISAEGWLPIGYWNSERDNAPFTATFDGNDHTIANLYIFRGNTDRVGLFGVTGPESEIKRIGLTSGNVVGNGVVGGLVGWNQGKISASHTTSDVSGSGNRVGGLVGSNSGEITASYATSDVTGNSQLGGLVGSNTGAIAASYATGNVTGKSFTGGLVGVSQGSIAACYATGAVTSGSWIGGLVGRNLGAINACYSTGVLTSNTGNTANGLTTEGAVTASYWDTETSGLTQGLRGEGKTTSELQAPTSNTGIYDTWNPNWWDFGTPEQYPVLKVDGLSVDAQRSQPSQIPDRTYLYETIQPPIAPAYMNWYWGSNQDGLRELVTDFTIHNDVGDWSEQHGYYLILIQNRISEVGFYFGLQTDANGRGKAVVFSRWETDDLANARWADISGWPESGRHEGGFIGVRRSYNWGAGNYRIRMAPDGLESDGEWFSVWVTDLDTDFTTWIGSLKFPLLNGTATFRPHSSATIELYGVPRIRPIDIPQWHVSVKRPLGDNVPSVWGQTSYPWDHSDNALFNSDALYDPLEDIAHIRVGGTIERTNPAESFSFGD